MPDSIFKRIGSVIKAYVDNAIVGKISISEKGVANGIATLDGAGRVPSYQLPSYVDDIQEFANLAGFPATGESGIMYVTQDTNKIYRWTGSQYVEVSAGSAVNTTDIDNLKNSGVVTMSMTGTYGNTTGTLRKYFMGSVTFAQIRVTTTTTTSATSAILKKNGTTVKTVNLANGVTDSGIQTLTLSVTNMDYLTADVTGTGTDLVITIV